MASTGDMGSMLPGFDFLQGLFKTAGAGLPAAGQWVAPTLDPAELDKRIQDLKTVQFWLEQNARVLAATIQALEVQRMTLATLHNLNLPLSELTEALKIKLPPTPTAAPAPEPAPAPAPSPAYPSFFGTPRQAAEPPPAPPEPVQAPAAVPEATASAAPAAPPAVDPMQWWGALTQQFTELAAKAVKDSSEALASAAPLAAVSPMAATPPAGRKPSPGTGRPGAPAAARPATTAAAKASKPAATRAARKAGAPPVAKPRRAG